MASLSTVATAQAQAVLAEAPQEAAAIKNPNEGMDVVEGRLMGDCAPSITACGKLDSIKIEYQAVSTQFIINNITEEAVTTLKPETTTRTIWEVETVTTESQGWCRNTTTLTDIHRVETVHLNATITTTREFIPIITAKVTSTSTVSAKAVDQCIIKNPSSWPAVTGIPPVSAPPTKPSGGAGKESPAAEQPIKDTGATEAKEDAKKEEAKPVVSGQPKKKA
ncbi:hypothetical protein IQ07DRAFT_640664 [Pyrenochaeta sp. DS3sAY3a]|nr:hypothetical protein IQ07DRAFT_640664 [Pyrenochaeta sp. DS3sAY3a]